MKKKSKVPVPGYSINPCPVIRLYTQHPGAESGCIEKNTGQKNQKDIF